MDAIIILIVFVVCLALPFYLAKLMYWFWFWVSLAITLGIIEYIAHKQGDTLTKRFRAWADDHPRVKYFILAGMIAFWAYLLGHLFLGW